MGSLGHTHCKSGILLLHLPRDWANLFPINPACAATQPAGWARYGTISLMTHDDEVEDDQGPGTEGLGWRSCM